ncbi:MAG TPA: hypothetical protein VJU81_05185 [Methylomirabilota bacterium]|nr:hypothetical protein [Methylomirabilota bacterium]
MTTSTMAGSDREARITAAFMGSDGTVWHARCDQPLAYHGTRDGLIVDFFCSDCQEHLSLPLRRLPSLTMDHETGHWTPRFALAHSD